MNATTAATEGWPLHARFDGPIVMISGEPGIDVGGPLERPYEQARGNEERQ